MQLEVNTLFQTLTDVLHKIDPVELNATLSARWPKVCAATATTWARLLSGLNYYLQQLNPKLPQLQEDFAQDRRSSANIYGDAGPDLATIFDNAPTISKTIVDQQDNLNATLLARPGWPTTATATLAPAADDFIAAIQRLRAPLKVAGRVLAGVRLPLQGHRARRSSSSRPSSAAPARACSCASNFLPGRAGLHLSRRACRSSTPPAVRTAAACRTSRASSTADPGIRSPFLVTDNAYIPYQPNTELQFDAPSTLQFLFNGAFAERDEY